MCDGYWENDSKTVFIRTDNFRLEEVRMFISFLYRKFGLKATTKKRGDYYRLRFNS